jgi:hypothetical protein
MNSWRFGILEDKQASSAQKSYWLREQVRGQSKTRKYNITQRFDSVSSSLVNP